MAIPSPFSTNNSPFNVSISQGLGWCPGEFDFLEDYSAEKKNISWEKMPHSVSGLKDRRTSIESKVT